MGNKEFGKNVGSVKVHLETLDNLFASLKLSKVNFIKIDVEGAELDVLKGADHVLESAHAIVIEVHYQVKDIIEFLSNKAFLTTIQHLPKEAGDGYYVFVHAHKDNG